MFDCQAMQRFLHPYLDGELNARDAVEIQAHLDACPDCAALYRNEQLHLDLLKQSLPHPHAPEGLELKVNRSLDEVWERKRSRPWFRLLLAPSLAVALAVVAILTIPLVGKKSVPDFVEAAVTTHETYATKNLKLDVQSHDPVQVSRWLQERTGFTVSLALEPVKNLKLLGGRLLEIQGKKAVFLAYEVGGHPLSLVMTAAQGVELFGSQEMVDKEKEVFFYQSRHHGFQTLSWTLDGMAYVSVSDTQELNKQVCQICHTAGQGMQFPTSPRAKGI